MIILQELKKEDLNKIVLWNHNKSADFLLQWAGNSYSYPLTLVQAENYLFNSKKDTMKILIYKIIYAETNEFIGTVELREVDKDNKVGRVCRFLIGEEAYRGKGMGSAVLKELLKIGFYDFEYKRITLGVFDFNVNAIRCYEKAGFENEHFKQNSVQAAKEYWNLYDMVISRSKWESMQQ